MITLSPQPAHPSQVMCLLDLAQPPFHSHIFTLGFPSNGPPYCQLPAHSNPKLSPAHVAFLPGFGPTPLMGPQLLPLPSNLFPGSRSDLPKYVMPLIRTPQLSLSTAPCPDPSAWPSEVWSQSTFSALRDLIPAPYRPPSSFQMPDTCSSRSNLWNCYSFEELNPKQPLPLSFSCTFSTEKSE